MKRSKKADAPQSVLDWIRIEEERTGEKPPFDMLQRPEKDELRRTLLEEQGFLCAYCGRPLSSDFSDSHVDHFWPQAVFNGLSAREDRRLDHANLFQSCGPSSLPGNAASGLPYTCGNAKGDWYDERYSIMPSEQGCEERFMYDGAGQIKPSDSRDQGASNMIVKLRLYDPSLNNERKKIIHELEVSVLRYSPTLGGVQEEIDRWLETDGTGRASGFSQVAKRYLETEGAG